MTYYLYLCPQRDIHIGIQAAKMWVLQPYFNCNIQGKSHKLRQLSKSICHFLISNTTGMGAQNVQKCNTLLMVEFVVSVPQAGPFNNKNSIELSVEEDSGQLYPWDGRQVADLGQVFHSQPAQQIYFCNRGRPKYHYHFRLVDVEPCSKPQRNEFHGMSSRFKCKQSMM